MKRNFFIIRTLVLVLFFIMSCSDDNSELLLDETQQLKTLKTDFPNVYEQVDIGSYQTYSVNVPDKGIINVEAYKIHNENSLQSYYVEMDGRKLITSITDKAIIQTNIETNQQFIIPRVYNNESKRLVPDFEKTQSGFIHKTSSSNPSEVGVCESLCWAGYVGCMIGCGVTGITIATQDTILPGIYDVIGVGVFTACAIACEVVLDVCLDAC